VWPSPDVVATIAALARPTIDGVRWTTPEQWHATLRFLGDADVDAMTAVLDTVTGTATTAVMGPATARFGHSTLHAPVVGLDALAAAVAHAFGPEDRVFHGHLTLARARARRGVDLRPLTGAPVSGEWPVTEVTLVASELHPKGARYEIVARVQLH
jgi:2'-5' RNA ligase